MVQCNFNTLRERDMDLLFLEAFVTDHSFAELIVEKTQIGKRPFTVVKAELSWTEAELGESDITFVIETQDIKFGILVEDKIDALAMPHQHERYVERGKKGIKKGEYKDFAIFIFCPEKYYKQNSEAKLYEHFLSYEMFQRYFDSCDDPASAIRSQQLAQAIKKAKKSPETELNKDANAFFKKYKEYQQAEYPELDLRTKGTSNGWWAHYGTRLGSAYLYHKMQEGFVDLTFPNAASDMAAVEEVAGWLRSRGVAGAMALPTGQAGAVRITVPGLRMREVFENTKEDDLRACFDAIKTLVDFANVAARARELSILKKRS